MSIAFGRPEGPDTELRHIIIFVVLSIIIHLGVIFGLFSYGSYAQRLLNLFPAKENKPPVMVDVLTLPPEGAQPKTDFKRPPTHFADRARSAEKETYPEAPKVGPYHPAGGGFTMPRVSGGSVAKAVRPAAPAEKGGSTKQSPAATKNGGGIAGASKAGDLPVKGFSESGQSNTANAMTRAGGKAHGASKNNPNLFLSNDQIADLERRYEAESPKGEKGKTLQLNTSELKYQRYLLAMKEAIERKWEYPSAAAANGWQGALRINFTINRDGTVRDIRILKSSDYPVLDDAAVTALKLAAPFPPFPSDFTINEINIKGTFEYNIMPNQGATN